MGILGSLAVDARLNISVDLRVHARPPVVVSDKFSRSPFAWVSGKG